MARFHSRSSFKNIDDVLKDEELKSINETIKNFSVIEDFEKIFPELKKIAIAKKVDKGTLFLHVENSVWKSELNFQKAKIVEKINSYYKEQILKSIKFL